MVVNGSDALPSKNMVKKSGKAISKNIETEEDIKIINDWRRAHLKVLGVIYIFYKRKLKKIDSDYKMKEDCGEILFSRRLKRLKTIIDKLGRRQPDGTRFIADASQMHDYAGFRFVFSDIEKLNTFRDFINSPSEMKNVEHSLRTNKGTYDYIDRPKESGYRGIHDVFVYNPSNKRKSKKNIEKIKNPFKGLFYEVQYRTLVQHAWATALEVSDFLDQERTKFQTDIDISNPRIRFFKLVSDLFARYHEKCSGALQEYSLDELKRKIRETENEAEIIRRLRVFQPDLRTNYPFDVHNVLCLKRIEGGEPVSEVYGYKDRKSALIKEEELQKDENNNVVYVASSDPRKLREIYTNYFNDVREFLRFYDQAMNSGQPSN